MKTITNKMQEKYNTCFYHPCFSLSLNLQGSPGSLFILIITKENTLMCRNSVNSFSHIHFLGCLRWNAHEIFERNFSISNWFLKSRLFLIAIKCLLGLDKTSWKKGALEFNIIRLRDCFNIAWVNS